MNNCTMKLIALQCMGIFLSANAGLKDVIKDNRLETSSRNVQMTLKKGKLVVGFDKSFPPYSFKQGEVYVGFDVDLAREVCSRLKVEFVPRPIDWLSKDDMLAYGGVDCIWSGFTTQGRENSYTWTVPYIDNSQVVLVRKESVIRSMSDLHGMRLGVQASTPADKALSGANPDHFDVAIFGKGLKIVRVKNSRIALYELDGDRLDAVVVDMGYARRKLKDSPETYRVLGRSLMRETLAVGFKKSNIALKNHIELKLKEVLADGTAEKLACKYGIEPCALIKYRMGRSSEPK